MGHVGQFTDGSRRLWVTWVMGQFVDGSRGSQVTKCDPLSALLLSVVWQAVCVTVTACL